MKTQQKYYIQSINQIIRSIPQMFLNSGYRRHEDIMIDPSRGSGLMGRHSFEISAAAWACSARIEIVADPRSDVLHGKKPVQFAEVNVGWSSCNRSLAGAHAALEVYKEALRVASLIQAFVEGNEVIPDLLDADDIEKLLNTSRVELVFNDDSEKEYDSIEDARKDGYNFDFHSMTTVKLYDRDDAHICNFDPVAFFTFNKDILDITPATNA